GWSGLASLFFFFFQAEDGIRDDLVTGVQTCALPISWNAPDNFGMIGSDSIMALWKNLTGRLFNVVLGLTAVFLVVGGIVIMNIMLASVTERTREIGLRRSLGARKRHIVMQFLTESAVLAAVGGMTGIILAYAGLPAARAPTSLAMPLP